MTKYQKKMLANGKQNSDADAAVDINAAPARQFVDIAPCCAPAADRGSHLQVVNGDSDHSVRPVDDLAHVVALISEIAAGR
jgi:hypothetical protein